MCVIQQMDMSSWFGWCWNVSGCDFFHLQPSQFKCPATFTHSPHPSCWEVVCRHFGEVSFNIQACESVWEGRRNLWFLGELPHHLLPWQLNSKGRKSRNEERQTDKGGEENWMRNAYWVGEERRKGNGGNKRCTFTVKSHHSGSVCSAGWRIWNLIFVIEGCCCSTAMSTHTNHRVLLASLFIVLKLQVPFFRHRSSESIEP